MRGRLAVRCLAAQSGCPGGSHSRNERAHASPNTSRFATSMMVLGAAPRLLFPVVLAKIKAAPVAV